MYVMLKRADDGSCKGPLNRNGSPMLLLVTKVLVAPVLLTIVALVERRWGGVVGGWLLGLPLTSGPLSFLLLTEHGPRFAENAARGTLLGLVGAGVFCAVYFTVARSRSWGTSLALGVVGCFAVMGAVSQIHLGFVATMVLAAVVLALVAAVAASPKTTIASPSPRGRDLAFRVVIASLVVAGVSVASTMLGSQMSGMLTTLPAITATMAVTTHRSAGRDSARRLLRGSVAGLWGGVAFFAVVGVLVTVVSPGLTYLAAVAAAVVVAGLSGALVTSPRLHLTRTA